MEDLEALIRFGDRSGEPLPASVRIARRSLARWVARLERALTALPPAPPTGDQPQDPPFDSDRGR